MPRPTDWIDTIISLTLAPMGGSAIQSLMTGVAPVNMRGMTLIRTIISLSLVSQTVAGAWGVQRANLGIGVADQDAFAAGALPDPDVATDKPARGWVWRSYAGVAQNGSGAPVIYTLTADIRGARKIENGELYIAGVNTDSLGTAFTVFVGGLIRTLYKL